MKMLEHVEEGLIRQRVEIDEMQCGFMLGCGTTDAIFRTFSKKYHFFGQKISKILCLAFDFICIYYMSSDY